MTEFINSFEEVDTAMFDIISGFTVGGQPVEVTYYTPDVDLVKVDPPALVIYRTMPYRDLSRWSNEEDFYDNPVLNEEGNPVEVDSRKHPEPWSIMYTVKTVYEYQSDGVTLNDNILRLFPRGSYITINNVDYPVEQTTAGLWGSQYKDFGRVEDGKRKFQETYTFKVDVYLEAGGQRNSVKTVQTVETEGGL